MSEPNATPPRLSAWQFSLRWILVVTALVAVVMAWWTSEVREVRKRRLAMEQIIKLQNEAVSKPDHWIQGQRTVETTPLPWWLAISGEENWYEMTALSFDLRSYDDGFEEPSPIDDASLPAIASFPKLQKLELPRSKITDAGLASLAPLLELTHLNLTGVYVSDSGLREIGKLRALESLLLHGAPIRGDGLAALAECPLRELSLADSRLEADRMPGLARLQSLERLSIATPTLERLNLVDLPNLREVSIQLSAANVSIELARLPALERAAIHCHTRHSLRSLKVKGLPLLSQLDLQIVDLAPNLKFKEVVVIRDLPAIKSINAFNQRFALKAAPQFALLLSLRDLSLGEVGPDFGDEQIARFARHPNLKRLVLGKTSITDAGMKSIASMRSLESLILTSDQVSAAGIESLADIPQLSELYLSGLTGIEDIGAAFARFPALENLTLADCDCRSVAFIPAKDGAAGSLARLKKLQIRGTAIESICVAELPALDDLTVEFPKGRSLDIRDLPKLHRLNVSFKAGQVIEKFLLAGLPELRWISAQCGSTGARLPEHSFEHIHTFPKLRNGIIWGLDMPPVVHERLERFQRETKTKLL